jgi:hypothetical protein
MTKNFFDFFDVAVKKFCGPRIALKGGVCLTLFTGFVPQGRKSNDFMF